MISNKVKSYLGFARKAGKLSCGYNTCLDRMKEIKLLIISSDVSANSREKLIKTAEKQGTKWITAGTGDELSAVCGRKGRNIFGVEDSNLSKAILKETEDSDTGRCFNDDKNS